jgi:hypothetical protein
MYRDENAVWDGVRWDSQHPAFFALGRGTRRRRGKSCEGCRLKQVDQSLERIVGTYLPPGSALILIVLTVPDLVISDDASISDTTITVLAFFV